MVYTLEELSLRVRPVAQRFGLQAVYVFGSYARGEALGSSDVDLLVEIGDTSAMTGFFRLGELYSELENALGKKIDLVTVRALEQPSRRHSDLIFRENVRRERRIIYAAA